MEEPVTKCELHFTVQRAREQGNSLTVPYNMARECHALWHHKCEIVNISNARNSPASIPAPRREGIV